MPEEIIKKVNEEEEAPAEEEKKEEPAEEKKEEPAEEEKKEESNVSVRLAEMEKQLGMMKEERKQRIVEGIVKINPTLKSDDLMKESEDKLDLISQYEAKLQKTNPAAAVVEEGEESEKGKFVEDNGMLTMSEKMYSDFNKEIRERVR